MRRALLLGGLVFAVHAAAASAVSVTVGCKQLQSELSKASAGETITLDELCKSGFPYLLPAVPVTLAGTPGAGFSGGSSVQLEGGGASVTIQGLTFENADNTFNVNGGGLYIPSSGGAVAVSLEGDLFRNDIVEGPGVKANTDGGGAEINNTAASVTVRDSTFVGDKALAGTEGSAAGGGLAILAATATLSNDTFTGNVASSNGFGGGLMLSLSHEGGVLSGSQFSGNTATDQGGGASIASGAVGGVAMTLTGDSFTHNVVADPNGTSTDFNGYGGGGLAFVGFGVTPTSLIQRGDVFDSNSVSFKAAPSMSNGGGEAIDEASVQSAGDRFTNNSLQSPDEAENKAEKRHVFGWGAGLSVIACGDLESPPPTAPDLLSTFADAVVTGNTLGSGPSANGAGIYVGVLICPAAYAVLDLADSTVSGNTISGASGPVAGIDGGPHDVLALTNTILAGDTAGAELGGFASITASYSDLCSGAAPFAGAGNICADPKLVSPAAGDVHETGASPTLGAGSNALVPAGLASDAYGGSRILGPLGCGSSPAAIVDIGAAEYSYPAPACAPPLPLALALAPRLSALGQTAKTWREGKLPAHLSAIASAHGKKKKPPIGTTFSFTLDRAATVTFKFTTSAHGRRVGNRCVAQTRANRRRHRCTRTITAGSLSFAAHAGTNRVSFDGVISKHKRLAAGKSYELLVTASVSGLHSPTGTLRFTIAR